MISVVCFTYGRYNKMKRLLSFFVNQDYEDKELIIFNTAPVEFDQLPFPNVKVINQQLFEGQPFTNMTQICQESFKHVSGELYSCWADDDFYMPYHLSQCIEMFHKRGLNAWKPKISLWSANGGETFENAENNMESTIIVKTSSVFFEETLTGEEHIPWLTKLRDDKQIEEREIVPPSYAFVWGDGTHKNSANIQDLNNFENHKRQSTDFGSSLNLIDVSENYRAFYNFTKDERLLPYL